MLTSATSPATVLSPLPTDWAGHPSVAATDADRHGGLIEVLHAFRRHGGLARGDEVAESLSRHGTGDISTLARWIVARQIVSLDWQGELWIPLFQFDAAQMRPLDAAWQAVDTLKLRLDPGSMARWWALPATGLGGRCPADAVSDRAPAVQAWAIATAGAQGGA